MECNSGVVCQKKDDEARGYLKEDANDNGLKKHPKDIWIKKKKKKHYKSVPNRIKKVDQGIVFLTFNAKNKGLVKQNKSKKFERQYCS